MAPKETPAGGGIDANELMNLFLITNRLRVLSDALETLAGRFEPAKPHSMECMNILCKLSAEFDRLTKLTGGHK